MNLSRRDEMLQTISCLSKDAFGFRVRKDWDAMSDEELQSDWDWMVDLSNANDTAERVAMLAAQKRWEIRMNKMVSDFGISFGTALRWDMEATEVESGDYGHYCYHMGISYDLEERLEQEK
jgi:hypothetical protein